MRPSIRFAVALVCALSLGPAAASQAAADLPRREMHDKVFTNAKGWLVFKGNVEPGWNKRNVQVYKRLCKSCEWNLVKTVATDGEGRWRTRIYAPRTGSWYWKALVPRSGKYGTSVTRTYRTFVA